MREIIFFFRPKFPKYVHIKLGVVYEWLHGHMTQRGLGFCDDSNRALVMISVTMDGKRGCQKRTKLRDVIYERANTSFLRKLLLICNGVIT
jgi:hypothetical protein